MKAFEWQLERIHCFFKLFCYQEWSMLVKTNVDLAKRIVHACEVRPDERLFVVGSFGRFINFSAQQFRAINLVWALDSLRRITVGKPIAVVGGGLTGITLATALVMRGYCVDLYESQLELMAHQRATDHRLVHPTINYWPSKHPLTPATNLPFLNWVSGPCSKVLADLVKEVYGLRDNNADRFQILQKMRVVDIDSALNGYLLGMENQLTSKPYDAVITAVGFGPERHHRPFDSISYWYPDGIEHESLIGDVRYFLVSGCGDGGLIDALRIIHRDFEKGGLIFETAYSLDGTDVARRIREVEKGPMDATKMKNVYETAAKDIATKARYKKVHSILKNSSASSRPLLRLSAKNGSSPFVTRAAPIHKLMIAHAAELNKLVYQKGELKSTKTGIAIGGKIFPKTELTRVIIRHGPVGAPLVHFLSEHEIGSLKAKQEDTEHLLTMPAWPKEFGWLSAREKRGMVKRLHLQASRAIRLTHPLATVGITSVGYEVALPKGASRRALPKQVFGIPVREQK